MERRRRAERLIATLRWPAIALGLAVVGEHLPATGLAAIVGSVVAYNGILTWCVQDRRRFDRYGRPASLVACALDVGMITLISALAGPVGSLAYVLYCFVLVTLGLTTTNLRNLYLAAATVLAANAWATIYTTSHGGNAGHMLIALGERSTVIAFGCLVGVYVAKSCSQDDLLSERGSHLRAILNCGLRLTGFRDVHELARYVLEAVAAETAVSGGQLCLVNEESGELEWEAAYVRPTGSEKARDPTLDSGSAPSEASLRAYANWTISSGKEFLARGENVDGEEATEDDVPVIAMPLVWHSSDIESAPSVLGVLVVWGAAGQDFHADAIDVLRILTAISSAAIVNLRLYTNLQKSFLGTLHTLANGLEARDEYTQGHSERVMRVACRIADRLGVSAEGIEVLRNASLLHDIGKIGVPDAVLRKSGKLTAEEWETMRRHPVVSEEICRPLGLAPEVLFLVKHHHERLDEKGYPSGLAARDQPVLQRILAVADSFDAMRSRRPYRDAVPEDELRAELNRWAGRTMDPTVVDALMRLMDDGELNSIYEEHDRAIGSSHHTAGSAVRRAA